MAPAQTAPTPYEWPEEKYGKWLHKFKHVLQSNSFRIEIRQAVHFEELCSRPVQQVQYNESETAELLATAGPTVDEDLLVLSQDGYRCCLFLKAGLSRPWRGRKTPIAVVEEAISMLKEKYPPPAPKKKDIRHTSFKALEAKYGKKNAGLYHFAYWIQAGHGNSKTAKETLTRGATISSDVIGAGYKFDAVVNFFKAIAPLSQTLGMLFEGLDQENYIRYKENFNIMAANSGLASLKFSNRACFLGVVLLVNLCAEPHKDASDTRDGWVAICCFGDFSGGNFVVPQLQLCLDFKPGDVIFLRSALFTHFVEPFIGERSSMVFFTHENMMTEMVPEAEA